MRKFRLKTSVGYKKLREGEVYDESFTPINFSVIQLVDKYPEDWEEVFDEPKKLHKDTDLGYFAGLALQGLMTKDYVKLDINQKGHQYTNLEMVAEMSVKIAQALIKALDKEVKNEA